MIGRFGDKLETLEKLAGHHRYFGFTGVLLGSECTDGVESTHDEIGPGALFRHCG